MIVAYIWKCDRTSGWTTAYWDDATHDYDAQHFELQQECLDWLRCEAGGMFTVLDYQQFFRKMDLDDRRDKRNFD